LRRNSPSPELTEGDCEDADTAEKRPGEQWTRVPRPTDLAANISDGQTFEVLHHQCAERIRLSGIDCPEKGQAYGKRAKETVLPAFRTVCLWRGGGALLAVSTYILVQHN